MRVTLYHVSHVLLHVCFDVFSCMCLHVRCKSFLGCSTCRYTESFAPLQNLFAAMESFVWSDPFTQQTFFVRFFIRLVVRTHELPRETAISGEKVFSLGAFPILGSSYQWPAGRPSPCRQWDLEGQLGSGLCGPHPTSPGPASEKGACLG